MTLLEQIKKALSGRKFGEADAPADTGMAPTRATGGVPEPEAPDQHSTTGTTPNDTFVGRVAGDDAGVAERTGAEARAEHAGKDRESREPREES